MLLNGNKLSLFSRDLNFLNPRAVAGATQPTPCPLTSTYDSVMINNSFC